MEFLCEHVVDKKREGAYRLVKVGIIALWIMFPLFIIGIGFSLAGALGGAAVIGYATIFIIPLTAFLAGKFAPMTLAFGEVAFEYTVASGEMSFAKIYGNRFRREWFSLKIADIEKCAPLDSHAERDLESIDVRHTYRAISSDDAPYIYYAIFTNSNGERCLMYFEVIKKSLKMIKTYFPSTVMTNLPY